MDGQGFAEIQHTPKAPQAPRLLSRRDFLRLGGGSLAGAAFFNTAIGESIAHRQPELPKIEGALSQYQVGWDARPWVWVNLSVASKHLNNQVILPGEEVSIIDLLKIKEMDGVSRQNRDPRKGYIAAQMSDPKQLDGWGYGLCLSSTALYRATLDSPLLVTERGSHYDAYPTYFADPKFPIGTDAAVFEPDPGDDLPETDLKLKNPTQSPIHLKFEIFDTEGNLITPPDNELSQIQYKATYLDHATRVLRDRLAKKGGFELPKQALPEYTFGNRRIFVRASIVSDEAISYSTQWSKPQAVQTDPSNYRFDRTVTVATGSEKQEFRETHHSQYGKSPIDILAARTG